MIRTLAMLTVASAAYGFALGSGHSWLYAWRNLLKFPLLIVGTGLVCGFGYFVVGVFVSSRLRMRDVEDLVLTMFKDLSVLLASLGPPTFFIGRILVGSDDSRVGEYDFFLGLNVGFVALSGVLALARQAKRLFERVDIGRGRSRLLILAWLAMTLFVGGQGAFYLRPMFGLPASRGGHPPFALGSTPDVRGATNFYEAVWQVFDQPDLPPEWPK